MFAESFTRGSFSNSAQVKNGKTSSPGRDRGFEHFFEVFAKAVCAESASAVKQQIRFAMPETTQGSNWGRQAQTAILNKAAALEWDLLKMDNYQISWRSDVHPRSRSDILRLSAEWHHCGDDVNRCSRCDGKDIITGSTCSR